MLRPVAAVILGYLGMAVWVMMSVGFAWKLLGTDFAINPETNEATVGWILLNIPLGFMGAVLGGWLAASIAKEKGPAAVRGLALLVLVFGFMLAVSENFQGATREIPVEQSEQSTPGSDTATGDAGESTADPAADPATSATAEPVADPMRQVKQPTWYAFVIPFIGLVGVLVGGNIRSRAAST